MFRLQGGFCVQPGMKNVFNAVFNFVITTVYLNRLTRHLYPTDQELKAVVGIPKEKHKKGKHSENGRSETFQIPRNINIKLETAPVTRLDVVHLKFYSDFIWLLDFSFYTAFVYIITEVSF